MSPFRFLTVIPGQERALNSPVKRENWMANGPYTQASSTADLVRDFDEALDELFADDIQPLLPLPDDTREEIYLDHD